MKKWATIILAVTGVIFMAPAYSNDAQMKNTLVKIVNQLEAIKPLINQAQEQQSENPRVKVHFDSWIGPDGTHHNGLRQDINAIQAALINAINKQSIEPRIYKPIKDDFIGGDHV